MAERYFAPCVGHASEFGENGVSLPVRSTKGSAGYDFFCTEDVTLPSVWSQIWRLIRGKEVHPTYVYTNVKAKMRSNEVLFLYNRSSNPGRGILLSNGVGVIDSDYFSNEKNDGNIGFGFYNIMPFPVKIKKGQKIGQGIFSTYLKVSGDTQETTRTGGYGSTGA